MSGSHLAKAPATTASSTEAFGDLPAGAGGGHPLSASMALPPSAAAAHLSKHSSSSDLGALSRGSAGAGGEQPYASSPGRMSFMAVAASNLGLGGGSGGSSKRRSVSESDPAAGASGRE
jgi:hypothetical protein